MANSVVRHKDPLGETLAERTRQLEKLRNGLIVSCQAGVNDALYGPDNMALMSRAAALGGACAIRANGADDISAIRAVVDLPIIGIFKQDWRGLGIRITPTFEAAMMVAAAGASIIAIDATRRAAEEGRPVLAVLIRQINEALGLPVMADVSNYDEGIAAAQAGAQIVASTLSGYTEYSPAQESPDYGLVARLAKTLAVPVIAEGRIATPVDAAHMIEAGAFAVVVGSMITLPRHITKQFASAVSAVIPVSDSILGVDIGGTKISAGIVDRAAQIGEIQTIPTQADEGGGVVLERIIGLITKLVTAHPEISRIGISTAGDVDADGRIFYASDLMPDWAGIPLRSRLQEQFNLPVKIENDGQAATLAEALYGAGQGYPSILGVTVGTGIGGGFVVNGSVYAGASRAALSLGQLIVERNGIACHGGERGRLECYASGPALIRFYNDSVPPARKVGDGEAIMQALQAGDPEALLAVESVADWLGLGISNVLNVLNPGVVVVGGGVARLGNPFFESLRKSIQHYAYPIVRDTPIFPAQLGINAGIIGAAALFHRSFTSHRT